MFRIANIDAASCVGLPQLSLGTNQNLNRGKGETPGELIMTSVFSQVCRVVLLCC